MTEKPYAPTARRLAKARRSGHVAVSPALVRSFSLCVLLVLLPGMARATVSLFSRYLQHALAEPSNLAPPLEWATDTLLLALPALLAAAAAAAAVTLLQTGGNVAPRRVALGFLQWGGRFGATQPLSPERTANLLESLLARSVVALAAAWLLVTQRGAILGTLGDARRGCLLAGDLVVRLGWLVAVASVLLGAAHWAWLRHLWWQGLRLTPSEWRREMREALGDAAVRGARSQAHREFASAAPAGEVKDADLIVLDGERGLIAVRYRAGDQAPVVLARWVGREAARALHQAEALGLGIVPDAGLARALGTVAIGSRVPERTYERFAELLAPVYAQRVPSSPSAS